MFRKWKYALCQHPMYLIIDQDSICAEREPPWGERTIEKYIERIKHGLNVTERHPDVKLGLDISAVELKDLLTKAPDLVKKSRALIKKGKLSFVNGTYSQPHLHAFGSESNYRQFQMGLELFEHLVGYRVDTYAAQEPGVNEQTPQLLRAFNYNFAVVPCFNYAIVFLKPHEIVFHHERFSHLDFIHGDEFTRWVGLNGETIPLYLTTQGDIDSEEIGPEYRKDLWACPQIRCMFHDFKRMDATWIKKELAQGEFVLLNEALAERIKECPPKSSARLYMYWAYVEGISAENLSRTNRLAETNALQAEAMSGMAWLLTGFNSKDTKSIWGNILTCQHHDAYTPGAPELRKKSVKKLEASVKESESIINHAVSNLSKNIDTSFCKRGNPLLVFNTYPRRRKALVSVTVLRDKEDSCGFILRDKKGREITCQPDNIKGGDLKKARIWFTAELNGFGYESFELAPSKARVKNVEKMVRKDFGFENAFYKARICPDGTFKSIICKGAGEVIEPSNYHGNEFRVQTASGKWLTSRGVPWKTSILEGLVFSIVKSQGTLGGVRIETLTRLYRDLPWIDIQAKFIFNNTSWGRYWVDETKLNVYWPVNVKNGEIHHDIAFGAVKVREDRPLFVPGWLNIGNRKCGLAYINKGTPKHWVTNGVIANLFAWGRKGNEFSSRMGPDWPKVFDLRLKGEHVFEYSIYPHPGDWKDADVTGIARGINEPLLGFAGPVNKTGLPSKTNLLKIEPKNIITTSIQKDGNSVRCRMYEGCGKRTRLQARILSKKYKLSIETLDKRKTRELSPHPSLPLKGGGLRWGWLKGNSYAFELSPFQIGHLRVRKGKDYGGIG